MFNKREYQDLTPIFPIQSFLHSQISAMGQVKSHPSRYSSGSVATQPPHMKTDSLESLLASLLFEIQYHAFGLGLLSMCVTYSLSQEKHL